MSNNLSPELLAQLYYQESEDVFLTLLTLSHPSFVSDIRLVNNTVDVVSRANTFTAFPFKLRLPVDDGESNREVSIEFDNVSLELLDELRTVTTSIEVSLEMVLASIPDEVQISLEELKIQTVSYNKQTVSARLFLDGFLTTELNSEVYSPTLYPGIF